MARYPISWPTRVTTAASVAIALLATGCQRPQPSAPQPAGLERDPLRMVTWNIQKCEHGYQQAAAELARLDADIICLQEVIEPRDAAAVPNQTDDLAAALGMNAYSSGGVLDETRQQCLAILCRAPLSDTSVLATVPERNYGVTATTQWNGRPLRIVCVHLAGTWKADLQHVIDTSRARAADWAALQREAATWTGPVILAGDFNTSAGSGDFARLGAHLLLHLDTGCTFPSEAPLFDLDHVLLSPQLHASLVENVESTASDHRPLLAAVTSRIN